MTAWVLGAAFVVVCVVIIGAAMCAINRADPRRHKGRPK